MCSNNHVTLEFSKQEISSFSTKSTRRDFLHPSLGEMFIMVDHFCELKGLVVPEPVAALEIDLHVDLSGPKAVQGQDVAGKGR